MQIANNSMSRRRFLAVAGGTAAVAGLTMAGCSGNSSSTTEGDSAEGGDKAAAELSGTITAINPELTLEGLRLIHEAQNDGAA